MGFNFRLKKNSVKRASLFLGLILFYSVCRAQDYYRPPVSHQPRHNNGWKDSVPMRDFGSRDTTRNFMIIGPDSTNGKGFANVGFHASANGGIFITPNFGVSLKIGYNENTFDDATLNLLINGRYDYTINNNYTIWQFMGGVFGNFPLGKKSSLWVNGMAGLINANFPSFSIYNMPNFPADVSWNFTLPNANDFAYSFSIAYEKPISENISFTGTVSYTGSELAYPSLSWSLTGPYTQLPIYYTQHYPVTMSFGTLDFAIGLLFHF